MSIPFYEHWFSLNLRRNRTSFIAASITLFCIMLIMIATMWFFDVRGRSWTLIFLLFFVPYVLCTYCLTAQRLRDFNQTGWLALLWMPIGIADNYIGGAASVAFIIFLCVIPGTPGSNRYGDDPLA